MFLNPGVEPETQGILEKAPAERQDEKPEKILGPAKRRHRFKQSGFDMTPERREKFEKAKKILGVKTYTKAMDAGLVIISNLHVQGRDMPASLLDRLLAGSHIGAFWLAGNPMPDRSGRPRKKKIIEDNIA